MSYKTIFLFFVVFLEGVWCHPATPVSDSYGAQFSGQFSQDLASIINNIHNGVAKVTTPAFKFGIDTVPSLVATGIKSAAGRVSKMADAGPEVIGKLATGVGHAVGGAATAGSALAGGALQIAGSGLGAVNGVVGSAAQAGVDIIGRLGGSTAGSTNLVGNLGNALFTAAGDAAGSGVGLLSGNMGQLASSIGGRIAQGITNAEQAAANFLSNSGLKNLENWVLTLSQQGQANLYNLLKSFLETIVNIQQRFENMIKSITISAGGSSSSSTTSS
ncbi:glycine-rich protein 1-like [Homalodisca vitripennis]|uniref:glycine-rich protein 1-like n=1 Tax=Homalodisca vitripennis TaxID=197043 RepID=UPI001EE9F5F7|nr:glycine-rich protein 1-like [Homalodisca vitripennis]